MSQGDGCGDHASQSHQRRRPQRSSASLEKFTREVNQLLRQTQSSTCPRQGSNRKSAPLPPFISHPRPTPPTPPPPYRTSTHNSLPTLPPGGQLFPVSPSPNLHPSHSPSMAYICYPQGPHGYSPYPIYFPSYPGAPPVDPRMAMMGNTPSYGHFYSTPPNLPGPGLSNSSPSTPSLPTPSSHNFPMMPTESCNFLPSRGSMAPLVFMVAEPPPLLPPAFHSPSVRTFSSQGTDPRPPTVPYRCEQKSNSRNLKKPQEIRRRSIGTSPLTTPHCEETEDESEDELCFQDVESSEEEEQEVQEKTFAFGERHKVMRSPQPSPRTPLDSPPTPRVKMLASCHRLKNFRSLSPLPQPPPLSPMAEAELHEKLEQTVVLLQNSSWEKQFEGLAALIGHLRSPANYPTIQGVLQRIVALLNKMIRSPRTRLSVEAIRTARFLFTCLGKRLDQFVGVLGVELFSKTIPAAKFIRDEAEEALQVAVHCCSPGRIIHLLESKGGGRHKHGKVRTVAAGLMLILIQDIVGPKEILKSFGKEVLHLLLEWWEEPQILIRNLAHASLSLFVPLKTCFARAIQTNVSIEVEMRLRYKLRKLINSKNMERGSGRGSEKAETQIDFVENAEPKLSYSTRNKKVNWKIWK